MPLTFLDLPNELISKIIYHNTSEDHGRIAQVSRRLQNLADDNYQWNPKLIENCRTHRPFHAKWRFLDYPSQRLEEYLEDDARGRKYAAIQRVINMTSKDPVSKILAGGTSPEDHVYLESIRQQLASTSLNPVHFRYITAYIATNQLTIDEASHLDDEQADNLMYPIIRALILIGVLTVRQAFNLNIAHNDLDKLARNKTLQFYLIDGQLTMEQLNRANRISFHMLCDDDVWSFIENKLVTIEQILQLTNDSELKDLSSIVLCCIASGQLTLRQAREIGRDLNKTRILRNLSIQFFIAEGKLELDQALALDLSTPAEFAIGSMPVLNLIIENIISVEKALEFAAPLVQRVIDMIMVDRQQLGDNYPWVHELPEVQALLDDKTISLEQVHEIIEYIEDDIAPMTNYRHQPISSRP